MDIMFFGIVVAAILAFLLLIGFVMARLYRRATREVSLVRTGSGGRRVVMDGGIIVVPFLHEISLVNMRTLRLEVSRRGDAALITKDRMRVDVGVEFYVSVQATEDGIARAAQTLGDKTFDVNGLREMIEGKLIDGLRAVGAQMTMDELHEQRANFVQEVQKAVSIDLEKNGLGLESASLTALDQTPFETLDENNAFNAVGMRKLAEVVARSRKERAAIEAEADVEVRRSAMEAQRTRMQIERDEEEARIAREQEVELLKAAQEAEVARSREMSAAAREQARIQREQQIRSAEIAQEREIEIANQQRQIDIAQKSEEESRARGSADTARAEAIKAAEAIETARALAEAERQKQIAIIEAAREAERDATRIRIEAESEREAAENRAAARRVEAQAEADAVTIRATAKKQDMLAEAEGLQALTAAENALSPEVIGMRVDMARLEAMPRIVEQMVKPVAKIEGIRINQISGIGGAPVSGAQGAAGGSPVNQAFDAMLGMALQLPAMQKLGREVGLNFDGGLSGILSPVEDGGDGGVPEDAGQSPARDGGGAPQSSA